MVNEQTEVREQIPQIDSWSFKDELSEQFGVTFTDENTHVFRETPNKQLPLISTMDSCVPDQLQEYDPENIEQVKLYERINQYLIKKLMSSKEALMSGDTTIQVVNDIDKYKWYLVLANHRWILNLAMDTRIWLVLTKEEREDSLQEMYLKAFNITGNYDPDQGGFLNFLKRSWVNSVVHDSREIWETKNRNSMGEYRRAKERLEDDERYKGDPYAPILLVVIQEMIQNGTIIPSLLKQDPSDDQIDKFLQRQDLLDLLEDFFHFIRKDDQTIDKFSISVNSHHNLARREARMKIFGIETLLMMSKIISLDEPINLNVEDRSGEKVSIPLDMHELIGTPREEVEQLVASNERMRALYVAFLKLDERERKAIELVYSGRGSERSRITEAANILQLKNREVRKSITKGRKELYRNMRDPLYFIRGTYDLLCSNMYSHNAKESLKETLKRISSREATTRYFDRLDHFDQLVILSLLGFSEEGGRMSVDQISMKYGLGIEEVIAIAKKVNLVLINKSVVDKILDDNLKGTYIPSRKLEARYREGNPYKIMFEELTDLERKILMLLNNRSEPEYMDQDPKMKLGVNWKQYTSTSRSLNIKLRKRFNSIQFYEWLSYQKNKKYPSS